MADRADHHDVSSHFVVTWIGLTLIRNVPGSFILGIQAGLLTFIPTIGALIGGAIVVLASLASGWLAALSALCSSSAFTPWKATF